MFDYLKEGAKSNAVVIQVKHYIENKYWWCFNPAALSYSIGNIAFICKQMAILQVYMKSNDKKLKKTFLLGVIQLSLSMPCHRPKVACYLSFYNLYPYDNYNTMVPLITLLFHGYIPPEFKPCFITVYK